jgi:hypothetical protein
MLYSILDVTPYMTANQFLLLHTRIQHALEHDLKTKEFLVYLERMLPEIHSLITLPPDDSLKTLYQFLTRYIQDAPHFIQAIEHSLRQAKLEKYGQRFIQIAVDFFLPKKDILNITSPIELLGQAYLAHRLIEEVNDRLMSIYGTSLIPFDMTFANLVVHHILGEAFANRLDQVVRYAIDSTFTATHHARGCDLSEFNSIINESLPSHLMEWHHAIQDKNIYLRLAGGLLNKAVAH